MAKRELKPIEKYSVDELISGLSKLKSEAVKADEALDKTRGKVNDLTGSAENLNDTLNDTTSVLKKLFANRKGKNKTFFSDEDKKQAEKFTKNIQNQILANQQLAKLEKSISTGRVKYYTDEANALKHVKKAFEDYQSALAKNKQNDINKKSSDMLRWGHAYEALLPDGVESQLHTLGDEFIKHWNDVKDKVYDKTGGLSMYSKESFKEMFDLMKDMEKNGFNFELFKPAQIKFIEKTTEQVDKLTSSIEKMEDAIPKKSSNGLNDFFKDVERRVSAFNKKWEKGASETQKNLISLYQDMSYYRSKGGKNKEVLDILSSFEDNRETPLSNKNFAQLSSFSNEYVPEMLKDIKQVTTAIQEQVNMTEELTDAQKLNTKSIEESNDALNQNRKLNNNLVTMYRGTSGSDVVSNSNLGTFFSSKASIAKQYANFYKGNIYQAQVDLGNNLEIDGDGRFYERLMYLGDGSDETSQKIITLNNQITTLRTRLLELMPTLEYYSDFTYSFLNNGSYENFNSINDILDKTEIFGKDSELKNVLLELSSLEDIFYQISNAKDNIYGIHSTDEFAEMAKLFGYDSVIFKNINDSINSRGSSLSDVFAIFNKDNIHNVQIVDSIIDDIIDKEKNLSNIEIKTNVEVENHTKLLEEQNQKLNENTSIQDRNNLSLAEKIAYLKEIQKHYKFMEDSEDRIISMEEKEYDACGLNPKSEAESLKKIQMYETLCENIEKSNAALDEFYSYGAVLLKKNGMISNFIDELYAIKLKKSEISDIRFLSYDEYYKNTDNEILFLKKITKLDNYNKVDTSDFINEFQYKLQFGYISLNDALEEFQKKINENLPRLQDNMQSITTLPFFEEQSGQLAFIDGVKEAEFTILNAQENIQSEIRDTNEVLEGQIDLFKYIEELNTSKNITPKRPGGKAHGFTELDVLPVDYFKGIVRSIKDISDNLLEEGIPEQEINKLANEIRLEEIKALGVANDNMVRIIHRSSLIALESIGKTGLRFGQQGTLSLTSTMVDKYIDPNKDYGTHKGFGSFAVFDIPIDKYNEFCGRSRIAVEQTTEKVKELTQAEVEAAEKAKLIGETFGITKKDAIKEIADIIHAYEVNLKKSSLVIDSNGFLIDKNAVEGEFETVENAVQNAGTTIEDVLKTVSKHIKSNQKEIQVYTNMWKKVREYINSSTLRIEDGVKSEFGNDYQKFIATIGGKNITYDTNKGATIAEFLEDFNSTFGTKFDLTQNNQTLYKELYDYLVSLRPNLKAVDTNSLPDSIKSDVEDILSGTYKSIVDTEIDRISKEGIGEHSSVLSNITSVIEESTRAEEKAEKQSKKTIDIEEKKAESYIATGKAAYEKYLNLEKLNAAERELVDHNRIPIKQEDSTDKHTVTYQIGETGHTYEEGYKVNKRTGEPEDYYKEIQNITQVEGLAVQWTNKLQLAIADLNKELRTTKDAGVIEALNSQIERYQMLLGLVDEKAHQLDKDKHNEFSYNTYVQRVAKETETYRLELATKTARQIRAENEQTLRSEGKIEQMRSKYRKNASKIDDVFKNTTEYKELEKVINSFSKLEDISKVEKAFNNIENVIATFKRNAKGLETLDTVKSALNQKSSLGDEVKQYELKLLSLGYTADEIKDKLSDLYTTAKTIQDISLTDADADNNNVVKFGEELKRFYQLKNQLESNIKLETEQGKRTTNLYRELTKLENERYRIKQQLIKLDIDNKSDEVLLNRLRQINAEMLSLTDLKIDLEKLGVTDFHGEDIAFSNLRESHNVQLEDSKRQQLADKEKKSIDELNIIYDNLNQKRKKQYDLEKSLNTLSSKQRTQDAKELENVLREINLLLEERNKLSQYDNTGRRESYETYDLQLQKDLINDIIDAYGNANDKLRLYQAQANTPGNTKSYDAQIQKQKDTVDSLRIAAEQAADEMDKLSKAGKASKQEQWDTRAKFNNATANSDTASKAQDTEQSIKNKQAVIDEKEALDLLRKSLENVVKAYGQLASSAKNGSDSLLFKSNSKIFNDAMQQMQDYVDLAKNVGVSDGKINILQNDYFAKASSSVQQGGISSIDKYLNDIEKVEEKLRESGQLTEDAKQNFQGLREVFVNLVSDTDFSDGNELQKFILSLASLGNGLQSELDKISKQSKLTWINDQIQELDKLSYKSDDVKSKLTELKAKVAAYESAKQSGDQELINKAEIDLLKQAPGLIAKIQQLASGKGNLIDESIGKVTNLEDLNRALLEYAKNHGYVKAMGSSLKTSNGEVTGTFIDQNGAVVKLTASMDQMRNAMKLVSTTQQGAVGLFGSFKEALKSAGQSLTFYFSGAALIRRFFGEFRKGIDVLKKYDSALTNISYTMDMSKDQLDTLGQSAVDMAKDLSLSLDNTLKIYQIYANMQTTAEEISETARPTAILSNLSGVDASTASDQIQGILNQFNMLKDANVDAAATSMHVVDVLDKISANVAIDYAKGIGIITDAVTATGSAAADAGMSYEQLAAVSAKVAERTREDGSSIGNAIKTILTRISKVGKMPGYADEVDNETLSKASESLNEIGIAVYNADGSFRNISVILSELAEKWDGLTDAQQSNISYNVAATRQSNKFRAILEAWTSATELATDATNSFGNAEANQEKYLESYNGKLQQIKTQLDAFWLALFNSDAVSDILDFIIELTKGFNNLAEAITPLGALLVGFTGILGGITAGKYIKGKGLLKLIKDFSLFTYNISDANKGLILFGKSFSNIKSDLGSGQGWFYSIFGKNSFKKGDFDALNQYINLLSDPRVSVQDNAYSQTIANTSAAMRAQVAQCGNNIDALRALAATQQTATFGAKALTAAQMALNAVMGTIAIVAVTWAITKLVKVIDDYIHRVDRAKEALEEFDSKFADNRNTYKEHANLVKEVSESYDELASKVNTDTNYNLGLNEDEYADFIDMNNQLADAFPTLVKGYDESGNAIIDFGNDCASTTAKLKELLQAEQDVMNFEIAKQLPELLNDTKTIIESDYQKDIDKYTEDVERLSYAINKLTSVSINDINKEYETLDFSNLNLGTSEYSDLTNGLSQAVYDFLSNLSFEEKELMGGISYESMFHANSESQELWLNLIGLNEYQKQQLISLINANINDVSSAINDDLKNAQMSLTDAMANKESVWEDFTANLVAGMTSQASYQQLSAAEQVLAQSLVNGIDSAFAKAMGNDPLRYVRENIINSLDDIKLSDEGKLNLANAISEFTSLDLASMDITGKEEAQMKLIETIRSIIPNEEVSTNILVKLGLDFVETETNQFKEDTIAKATAKFGGKYKGTLQGWMQTNGVNTQSELAVLDELIAKYPTLNRALEEYERRATKATEATENSINASEKFSKLEMIEAINSMSDGFDVLDDIYADIIDGKTFDFTNLDKSKFEDAFSGLEEEYGNFIEKVSESPNDINACQEAFDELATAFINNKGILDNLTEENANVAASMLKNMGIANAEEVVTRALAIEKQKLTYSTGELANATYAEVYAKYASAEASSVEQVALAQLALEKINVNENKIDTSEDINQILNLAEAAMASTEVLAQLAKAKSVLGEFEETGYKYVTDAEVKEAYALIEQINSGKYDFQFQKLNREQFQIASGSSSIYTGAEQSLKAAEDAAKEATDSLVDFFERRVEVLEQAFGNLEAGIQNVLGAKAKNTVLAGQLEILDEETRNYTAAIGMYQEAAEGYLSLIPEAYREAAKNGDISILQINDEQTKEAIDNYQQWANKVAECTQKLEELKVQIRELELEKFNNIIKDFTDQFDLHGTAIDNIDKQIGLLEEAGELIGSSYYTKQIEQSEKQLSLLEQQKLAMVEQLNDSLSSGRIQTGTDEWLEMVNALQEVEGNILDCKTSIEEFNNALLEIQWIVFERIQTEFENLNSEMENLAGLFNDFNDIEVSDGKGTWTKEAIATLGLYAQQYELARYQANQYGEAIEKLKQDYLEGKYSATEYMDKLAELSQVQWDAINSAESLEDAIISLNETRVNEEIEAYRELIDAQIELIEQTDKLKKKQDELAEKSKTVADIEKQLAAMMYDNSAATVAKRKQLEAQLAEAKKDLSDTEYEYSKDAQIDALNKQFEDQEILLQESLKDRETLLNQSFNTVKENATLVGEQITLIAQQHGVIVSDAVITPWLNGETAIAGYGETLSAQSSVFIGNLIGVENEVIELQNKANVTSVALSNMFATRADNLVAELNESINSESQLNYATNLLRNSLVNTLESGYNISGIMSAMNSIVSGMSGVESSARRAAQAIQEALGAQEQSKEYYHMGSNGKQWYVKDLYGSYVKYYDSYEEASNALDKMKKYNYNYKGYAKGSKRIHEDQLAWTDEHGEREMIIRRSDGAILTRLERGDAIANANLAENLFKWGEINPNRFMHGLGSNTTVSKINVPMKESKPNITLDYDLNIGSFTDGEHLLSTIQKVSKDSATKLLNDINRDFRIHSR